MHMKFWWGYDIGDFLFSGLTIRSVGGFVATCLAVTVLSFMFECLRYIQAKQRQSELLLRSKQLRTVCPSESSTLLTDPPQDPNNPLNITLRYRCLLCGAEIGLWFILLNLSYIVMLSVMVYNGWLFLSAVIGGGLGYFAFGQYFMKLNLQNCQILRGTYCKLENCGGAASDKEASAREGESTPALEASTMSSRSLPSCHKHTVTVNVHAECLGDRI